MSKPVVRPASREDIDKFSSATGKPTIRAWCMEIDGRIIALGGVWRLQGRWVAFVDLMEEARQYKMHILRASRRFFEELRGTGIRYVYAESDPNEAAALKWATSLGFEPDARISGLYRWSA